MCLQAAAHVRRTFQSPFQDAVRRRSSALSGHKVPCRHAHHTCCHERHAHHRCCHKRHAHHSCCARRPRRSRSAKHYSRRRRARGTLLQDLPEKPTTVQRVTQACSVWSQNVLEAICLPIVAFNSAFLAVSCAPAVFHWFQSCGQGSLLTGVLDVLTALLLTFCLARAAPSTLTRRCRSPRRMGAVAAIVWAAFLVPRAAAMAPAVPSPSTDLDVGPIALAVGIAAAGAVAFDVSASSAPVDRSELPDSSCPASVTADMDGYKSRCASPRGLRSIRAVMSVPVSASLKLCASTKTDCAFTAVQL